CVLIAGVLGAVFGHTVLNLLGVKSKAARGLAIGNASHALGLQSRMLEQGAELYAWLQEGAYFYVCGDASRMAKDVDNALY
ncbi:LrgB family protein, partial [Pantoea agglomerans]|uniref:LrgB family protein n=1 Tax=Enterobacter agglomerans TaxID=549 RepID=UPI001F5C4AFD